MSGPYDPTFDHAATVLTQLHCHTTNSDGAYSPATIVADYLAAGYEALMLTDHNHVSTQPAGITTAITGQEHSTASQHIIVINSDYTSAATDAQTIIDAVAADGGFTEVAHPKWTIGMSFAEMDALTTYLGLEIHNGVVTSGAGGADPIANPGYAIDRWDALLQGSRRDVWGFSVDDFHDDDAYRAYDVGRVRIFAASNTVADLMAGLSSGNFVADVSNYDVTPGFPLRTPAGLAVTCPGAVRIEAWGAGGLLSATDSNNHVHPFDGTEEYVRLVAIGDYTEGFGSALPYRWAAVDGTWTVAGGTLALSSDASARRIILRRHREGDFTAQVDVKLGSGGGDTAALMFNVLDGTHFYMLRIGESTVSGYNNELAVAYTTDGNFADDSQLDNFTFDPTSGTWYTLKMAYTAATGRIQAKVWERATSEPAYQVDATDTTWKHGAFGFRANRTAEYDNLYVSGFQTFYQPVAVD